MVWKINLRCSSGASAVDPMQIIRSWSGLGWKGGGRKESLKDLVGQQSASRREATTLSFSQQQPVVDQFRDGGPQVVESLLRETRGYLTQVQAPVQTQSEKEAFFQRGCPLDQRLFHQRSSNIFFQDICGGKAHRLSILGRGRQQHRMGVDPETEIGPPRPVFEIVPRFETRLCEVGDLVLRNTTRLQLFAGGDIEICGSVFVRHEVCVIARSASNHFAT